MAVKIQDYLDGELQEIEVLSLRMVYESFGIFRNLYKKKCIELAERPFHAPTDAAGADAAPATDDATGAAARGEGDVGEDEEGRGISVGVAPAGSRPAHEDHPTGGYGAGDG